MRLTDEHKSALVATAKDAEKANEEHKRAAAALLAYFGYLLVDEGIELGELQAFSGVKASELRLLAARYRANKYE